MFIDGRGWALGKGGDSALEVDALAQRPWAFLFGEGGGGGRHLGAGLGLMVVPYFIPNVLLMAAASCAITALPWILRES